MHIKLHNFRCHKNSEFTFSPTDTGLVLLSGMSGSGKSTILKAIIYALFGKLRKPYTFGQKTCSVTLTFHGMKIYRSSKPNKLVVNDELEDLAAQEHIYTMLGMNYDEFLVSSYVPQKNNSSILSLAQTEQLRLIQILAFNNTKHIKYKNALKTFVNTSSDSLIKGRTQKQMAIAEIEQINNTLTTVTCPLTGENKEELIAQYWSRLKKYNKHINKLLIKKEKLQEKRAYQEQIQNNITAFTDKCNLVNKQLKSLALEQRKLQTQQDAFPENIIELIDDLAMQMKYLSKQAKLISLEKQYKKAHSLEVTETTTKIAKLKRNIWRFNGKKRKQDMAETELEQYKEQSRQLTIFTTLLQTLELEANTGYNEVGPLLATQISELDIKQRKLNTVIERQNIESSVLYCPVCEAPLQLTQEKLVHMEEYNCDAVSNIGELTIQLQQTKDQYNDLITLQQQYHQIQEANTLLSQHSLAKNIRSTQRFIVNNIAKEEELAQLEAQLNNNVLNASLNVIQCKIKKKTESLEMLSAYKCTRKLGEIEEEYHKLKQQKEGHQTILDKLAKIQEEIKIHTTSLANYTQNVDKNKKLLNTVDTQESISELNTEIKNWRKKQHKDEAIRSQVEKYMEYVMREKVLFKWEEKLQKYEDLEKIAELEHTAALTLKAKYIQAEIIAIETTINTINQHTRFYLDNFFTDDQLTVNLEAVEVRKGNYLKINNSIIYKNNEYDNISQLSGGEFDRCTLASICGINSLLNSPILILDESLSALDSSTNTEIIHFLHHLAEDKLILVCSHEAVKGIFDEIIDL